MAQRSAQRAFDRALDGDEPRVTAEDVLAAVGDTRPSVAARATERFDAEAAAYARL